MCLACILIDKSIPSPRTLMNIRKELDITDRHFEEVFNKVMDKTPEDEQNEYLQQLVTESYLDFFRNT